MIAVRTDIDALPIEEQVKHEFTSKYQGAMHACGHDIHMASILATGIQLKEIEDELNGRVRLIFQPAEELGHGAFEIINTGVLKGAKAVLGFHNYPTLKVNLLLNRVQLPLLSIVLSLMLKVKVRMLQNLSKEMIQSSS